MKDNSLNYSGFQEGINFIEIDDRWPRPDGARSGSQNNMVTRLVKEDYLIEDVLQRNRVRFGRVGTDHQYRLGKVNIVVGIGHSAIAPGIRYTCDRGRMTDPRLVVDVVGTPHGGEFTEQVSLLIAVFG